MKVFIGADHRGFELKEKLMDWLSDQSSTFRRKLNFEVVDCGDDEYKKDDDYVDYAVQVASAVVGEETIRSESKVTPPNPPLSGGGSRGIVICGSGVGVCVVANKFYGIRCGLGINVEQVREAREDDDINVLALAADYVSEEEAKEMVKVFLETQFSGEERHVRRLGKISTLEGQYS